MTAVGRGRLRAAVIGAGFVGSVHARALADHTGTKLVAVCGRTAPRASILAQRLGVHAYLSIPQMLERERPDIVCVCTPNTEHVEPALLALEGGAHIFVEKPMAWSVEDARKMVDVANANGRMLGVNFNHRFAAPYQRALEHVRAGRIGKPAYVAMKFAGDLYPKLNDPYCMLIETQGHSFDLISLFAGEIEQLTAYLADPRGMGIYTSTAIAMRLASGAVATLLGSWDSSYGHPGAVTFEMSGTEGRVVVENVVDAVRTYSHGRPGFEEWRPGLFDSARRDFWRTIDAHVAQFVESVRSGAPPPVSGEDGLRALELTFAAIRSFESGEAVIP